MAGRPKNEDGESVSFAIYKKTWVILKDLELKNLKKGGRAQSMKSRLHDAVVEYAKKEGQK